MTEKKQHRGLKWAGIILLIIIALILGMVYQYGGPFGAMMIGKPVYLTKPSPYKYGKDALTLMEATGYYAQDEEWVSIKEESLDELKKARNYKETHETLLKALKVAGGKHSTLWDDKVQSEIKAEDSQVIISTEETPKGQVLVLKLPSFVGDQEEAEAYANQLIKGIKDHPDVVGYVVDLRDNTGGDMGPMIAGLSPLIPDGEVMAFRYKSGDSAVTLEKGTISGGGTPVQVENLKKIKKPVAILQNNETASSAEATLLTFKGLENTRFFGMPSAGYASANMTYPMYDGTMMLLTVASDVDRTGKEYMEDPILPDVEAEDAMGEALVWIESQV